MSVVRRNYGLLTLSAALLAGQAAFHSASADPAEPAQTVATISLTSAAGELAGDLDVAGMHTGQNPAPEHVDGWFERVDKAQASQPSWITPLMTVTPRLEEEVRYDQYWEHLGNGATVINDGGGKGLELIPTTTNEIIFNVPPYETRTNFKHASGFGDDTFLIKQRLISANAADGDYIVTAFLGLSAPTGNDVFSNHAYVITPTIAGGKGFGPYDVQATFGVGFPTGYAKTIGNAVATNIAFQYHVEKFWPEFEVNDTYWSGGERSGKNQVLLTPGVIVGRFKLGGRFKANFGVGYQFAVAPSVVKDPITPTYSDAWISTVRVSF